MLDPRVRKAIVQYQQGQLSIDEAAGLLLQVHRETGCLELYAGPTAGAAERALIERFTELAASNDER